ncbi:MAG: ribosome biogenesis GTPase YlqF [Hydrogenophaga sp.]|uniref:ribosome biogenesis GTPase YlqF n=1 Tax=Hydrogenophaga sp. TaxID=1904254 RepID=UPI002731945E|nr:ribosome biogenesis GTPase YlqF [Hydrogenophaga sp.]MDP2404985.1 ribosome biogenesis GTPase YlqF [Hydrogenophaga sp.]MDZ4173096.1 ribosome biogenesis GTPase YlqF [Hydrogenophaga sp.]
MSIQWFPGHMHLTRKAIGERVKEIDVVIEMLDARLPGSSANPLMAELTSGRPTLKVLNKQDMADPVRTALWLAHYNALPNTQAIALDASNTAPARAIIDACYHLAPRRGGMVKPMRVLICGIPNVGKSTLINTLKGKRAAKTGDEAGVTRTESRIALADDFYLYDTPGMLWPRIVVPESGFNLAASGAVGKNAYDEQEVAYELMALLKTDYPALLEARYKLGRAPEAYAQAHEEELLEAIGRQRGALAGGGKVNMQKAAELVIADFRALHIGRITLETPEQFDRWMKAGLKSDADRAERKKALREQGLISPERKPKTAKHATRKSR